MNDSPLPGIKIVVTPLLPPGEAVMIGDLIFPIWRTGREGTVQIAHPISHETPQQRKQRLRGARTGRVEFTGRIE